MSYDVEYVKVWIFYLKNKPNQVYAYTSNKEYKNQFLKTRNPKCFKVEKITMDEFEFSMFANANRKQMLMSSRIGIGSDEKQYADVIMTYHEEDELEHHFNTLSYDMENLYRELVLHSSLKKKYKDIIEYLVDTSYPSTTGQEISRYNSLFGLYKLFRNTFELEENNG